MEFKPITFSELIAGKYDKTRRNAVITFDDGLQDNYDKAFPILQKFGFKATFFIIAGFDKVVRWVNPTTQRWSDYKQDGYTLPFPSMQNHHREELINYGMEIASHSLSHPKLNKISDHSLQKEIVDSKIKLEQEHGIKITSFCYPKGRYNRKIITYLANAGYSGACTTMPQFFSDRNNKLECGRFLIENTRLFKKILELAITNSSFFDNSLQAIHPFLKIKNTYF